MINQAPTVQSHLQYLLHVPFALLLCLETILTLFDGLWPKYHLIIKTSTLVMYTFILLCVAVSLIRERRSLAQNRAEAITSRTEAELIPRPEPLTYKYTINERARGSRDQNKRVDSSRTSRLSSLPRKQLRPSRNFGSFGLMSEVEIWVIRILLLFSNLLVPFSPLRDPVRP